MGLFSGLFGGSTKVTQTATNTTEVDVELNTTNVIDLTAVGAALETFLGITADQQKVYAIASLLQAGAEEKRTSSLQGAIKDGRYLIGILLVGLLGWWAWNKWR